MRFLKQTTLFVFLCTLVIGLSSAKITPKETNTESAVATQQNSAEALQASKLSYKQLKDMATNLKGEKLTLKEKIALKVFKKKIGKSMESNSNKAEGKSQLIALILVALLGYLGIHRFYLGYTWQGVVQLLTLGGCGIWALIDLIRIITGDLKPKDGEYDETL